MSCSMLQRKDNHILDTINRHRNLEYKSHKESQKDFFKNRANLTLFDSNEKCEESPIDVIAQIEENKHEHDYE